MCFVQSKVQSRREDTVNLSWKENLAGLNWTELEALYRAAPLGNKTAEQLQTAFTNSRYSVFVYEEERLVGAGRGLADGVDCFYLCDVALLPEFQNKGLGQQIVDRLLAMAQGHRKIILYAVPGKEPFYKRFGFRKMKTAMALFADEAYAIEQGYVEPDAQPDSQH